MVLVNCNLIGADHQQNNVPYIVTFPIGSTNASFDIIIYTDNVFEDDEAFLVLIDLFANGTVGTNGRAIINIIDTFSKYIHSYICRLSNVPNSFH